MSYFKPLEPEGQVAVIVKNGVYQQAPLYSRNGYLFAKVGNGFIRLAANGSTSQTSTRIEALVIDVELFEDRLGRLCDGSVKGSRAIPAPARQQLLGHNQEDMT